ncbi:hypothetical protein HMPREF1084_01764 [Clostridium butyricum 60E.3]|uniref:hypothetical protein n=1 Tax=Clostridium butyricum TaxID=1492 RepID=UPI0002D150F0|nr:hypothetical protein [Clostridium butyricum]ENZ33296.1 hypothetical protein HMPREF1084_01764 [Clostridium butyricum 60E.3]MDU1340538.1 hypothetical protein [Clostridium butyricum]MDU5168698.1 hypothetical protein [Haemophilus parainfluenzae]DAJ73796.1 MAG TPA: Major capsid protein [Caudoviricetes sp.]
MANVITLVKKTIPLLDKIYKAGSKTSILDGDISLTKAGANANSILVPKMTLDGLSDYGRDGSGYDKGATKLEFQEKKFNYDRGQKFAVDAMDNEETVGLAFGQLSGEFVRTKVIPEVDAFRFSMYHSKAANKKTENITTGKAVVEALRAAANTMDEKEVDSENRILFITPTLKGLVEDLDTTASKLVLNRFSTIIPVPQSRMFTDIELVKRGYKAKSSSKNINFMVIQKQAILQYVKHLVNKTVSPEVNQTSDDWLFFFRSYQLCEALDNKLSGIYASVSSTAATVNTTTEGVTQSE